MAPKHFLNVPPHLSPSDPWDFFVEETGSLSCGVSIWLIASPGSERVPPVPALPVIRSRIPIRFKLDFLARPLHGACCSFISWAVPLLVMFVATEAIARIPYLIRVCTLAPLLQPGPGGGVQGHLRPRVNAPSPRPCLPPRPAPRLLRGMSTQKQQGPRSSPHSPIFKLRSDRPDSRREPVMFPGPF